MTTIKLNTMAVDVVHTPKMTNYELALVNLYTKSVYLRVRHLSNASSQVASGWISFRIHPSGFPFGKFHAQLKGSDIESNAAIGI